MSEEVNHVVTQIHALVDILGSNRESWGYDIIARVTDQGSKPSDPSQFAYAAALAFRQKQGSSKTPAQTISDVKAEGVVPDETQDTIWYVHIKLWER